MAIAWEVSVLARVLSAYSASRLVKLDAVSREVGSLSVPANLLVESTPYCWVCLSRLVSFAASDIMRGSQT